MRGCLKQIEASIKGKEEAGDPHRVSPRMLMHLRRRGELDLYRLTSRITENRNNNCFTFCLATNLFLREKMMT